MNSSAQNRTCRVGKRAVDAGTIRWPFRGTRGRGLPRKRNRASANNYHDGVSRLHSARGNRSFSHDASGKHINSSRQVSIAKSIAYRAVKFAENHCDRHIEKSNTQPAGGTFCQDSSCGRQEIGKGAVMLSGARCVHDVCSCAGFRLPAMTNLSTRSGGRRPKSAKARNRGQWCSGGAAGAMGIWPRGMA